MVGGEGTSAAVEELVKETRQVAEFTEQFRAYSESEKHWKACMEFVLRHLPFYRDGPDGGSRLDQLLALSMVWANHLFLGCSTFKLIDFTIDEQAAYIHVEVFGMTRREVDPQECLQVSSVNTKEDFSSFHHAIECLTKRIDWKGF